jgi:hypothetical protein
MAGWGTLMAVPVDCWPNANAANISRRRVPAPPPPRVIFWTGPIPSPVLTPCGTMRAPCGPMRTLCGPMPAPCDHMRPHASHTGPCWSCDLCPCDPVLRGFPPVPLAVLWIGPPVVGRAVIPYTQDSPQSLPAPHPGPPGSPLSLNYSQCCVLCVVFDGIRRIWENFGAHKEGGGGYLLIAHCSRNSQWRRLTPQGTAVVFLEPAELQQPRNGEPSSWR